MSAGQSPLIVVPRSGDAIEVELELGNESTFAALLAGSTVHVYDRSANQTIPLEGARLRAIGERRL